MTLRRKHSAAAKKERAQIQTYVTFFLPAKTGFQGVPVTRPVDSRDTRKLDIPVNAYGFYFYDSKTGPLSMQKSMAPARKPSKFYFVASKVMDREDVKSLLTGRPRGQNKLSNVIWDQRLEKYDLFIVTRTNVVQQITDNNIVVNAHGEQIHPPLPPPPPEPPPPHITAQDLVAKRDIPALPPLRLKRAPPGSHGHR